MELIDYIQKIVKNCMRNAKLTEYITGTVTSVNPLEITILNMMEPLRQNVLILTESVIEKKIRVSQHLHQTNTDNTLYTISPETGIENGVILPIEPSQDNTYIDVIINQGLSIGDKVNMLRVLGGQSFIILSRVF